VVDGGQGTCKAERAKGQSMKLSLCSGSTACPFGEGGTPARNQLPVAQLVWCSRATCLFGTGDEGQPVRLHSFPTVACSFPFDMPVNATVPMATVEQCFYACLSSSARVKEWKRQTYQMARSVLCSTLRRIRVFVCRPSCVVSRCICVFSPSMSER